MRNFVLQFKSFLMTVIKIGVHDGIDLNTEKTIILTNTLALLYAFFVTTFFIAFALNGLMPLAAISFLWLAVSFLWLEVNRRHLHFLASFGLVLSTDIFGFIVCWLVGKEARFHYGYFAATGVPLILFAANKKIVGFFLVLAMLLFFALEWLPDSLANVQVLSIHTENIIHAVINMTVFLCTFATVYYYYQTNLKTEKKLRSSVLLAERINQQLTDAQKNLVQSGKIAALVAMAGGMAHEINSPLMAILMNAENLVRLGNDTASGNPAVVKKASAIITIGNRISKIIQNLKEFSANDEGESLMPVVIHSLITDTLDLCREKFKNHGIPISINQENQKLLAYGLPNLLGQTLLNLLNNSFDSILNLQEKWINIIVVQHGQFIEISILDSGRGIHFDVAERIFEPFYSTKEVGHGSGLGLSTSRGLMKRQNGDLTYDSSSPNTKFTMHLKLAEEYSEQLAS